MSARSTVDKIDQMTVVQLRTLLKEHNLPTKGLKAELVARARAHHLGTSSARRHTSPSRQTSPHRAASPPRSSPRSPSRASLSSSSGASLEALKIGLHHYIMADFPDDRSFDDIDTYLGPIVADTSARVMQYGGDINAEVVSEWQMQEIRNLSPERFAAAIHLMEALQSHNIFATKYTDRGKIESKNYNLWPIFGFFIVDGQFLLRQYLPYRKLGQLFPNYSKGFGPNEY